MEILDIVDEMGQPTGETVDRETAHRDGIPHRTAHVWLYREHPAGHIELLLQKRCAWKDAFPGCYDISSAGHIPAGVDFTASAVRELKEELGVKAAESDLLYVGDRHVLTRGIFHGKPYFDRQFSRVFLLKDEREADAFTPQPEEVESVRWMELDALMAAVRAGTINHCIAEEELNMVKACLERQNQA